MKFEIPTIDIAYFGTEDAITASFETTTTAQNWWSAAPSSPFTFIPDCPAELPMD